MKIHKISAVAALALVLVLEVVFAPFFFPEHSDVDPSRKLVSDHEAGHVVVGLSEWPLGVKGVVISAGILGYEGTTSLSPLKEGTPINEEILFANYCVVLAGGAAEDLMHGKDTGSLSDILAEDSLWRKILSLRGVAKDGAEEASGLLLKEGERCATDTILSHKPLFHRVSHAIYVLGSLNEKQIAALVVGKDVSDKDFPLSSVALPVTADSILSGG